MNLSEDLFSDTDTGLRTYGVPGGGWTTVWNLKELPLMLKNFRCYQESIRFYRLCEEIRCAPHLRDQLLRASSSIALNLSEGSARTTRKERKRFYSIAMGSLRECQTILELAKIKEEEEIRKLSDSLGAQIYCLLKALLPTPDEAQAALNPTEVRYPP